MSVLKSGILKLRCRSEIHCNLYSPLLIQHFTLQLTIKVTDVNDNPPKFDLPDYQAHNIDEDIPIGSSILRVRIVIIGIQKLVIYSNVDL